MVPRFGEIYFCCCLPLLPDFAILATWGPPFSRALYVPPLQDVLNFYNTATGNVLLAMSNDIERGQNSENWRLLNCYFSMIKVA